MKLVLSIVSITALAAMIGYFIRQSIWTRWILPMVQRNAKPKLLFDGGLDVIHVQQPSSTDADALAEIIRQINTMSIEERQEMSRKARQTALEFTDNKVAQYYLENVTKLEPIDYKSMIEVVPTGTGG